MNTLGGDNKQQSSPTEIYANVRNKALEEAARACVRLGKDCDGRDLVEREWKHQCEVCAESIRALKTEER